MKGRIGLAVANRFVGLDKTGHWPLIGLLLILALVYFPFANKAFTIDDTLFIKAAEQILLAPGDFYGGEVNWYGVSQPHSVVNKNPPLVAYLIALVAAVFGFREIALHTFFFLPVALSVIGIYLLGRQFNCNAPLTAAVAAFTPAFLIHATNVMSDSTLLMFWVWGMVFWINGLRARSAIWFLLAGLSISLGVLTKYTCIFLVPLIMVSGIWQVRKPGMWLIAVFLPILVMLGFEYYTKSLYGTGLFFDAVGYANAIGSKGFSGYLDNTLIGLSFLGGCFPIALLLVPVNGSRILKLSVAIFAAGIFTLVLFRGSVGNHSFMGDGDANFGLILQFVAFSLAGFCLVAACVKEAGKGLNHDSVLLMLWFFGIFVFACFLNWTINARSFILLVPAVGLLLARRVEDWAPHHGKVHRSITLAMIGCAGLLAVATTYADYAWADTARLAARDITSRYKNSGSLWFQGHWGFQFYMEGLGARPVDFGRNDIRPGEFMVIPANNTNLRKPDRRFDLVEVRKIPLDSWLVTMSPESSAGFYASVFGVMPYSFVRSRNETYLIFRRNNRSWTHR